MSQQFNRGAFAAFILSLGIGVGASPAFPADLYQGATISLFAGRPPGGGVDSEMRLVAQYFGQHVPGQPRVIALNMPGAGGVALANYLGHIAPKDGLTIGIPGRTAFLLSPSEENQNARYKLSDFSWIGSGASSNFTLWMRKGAGVTTIEQLRASKKTLIIGGSGNGNSDTVIPELLVKYEHLPLKIIRGYPGVSDEVLAMQRGEIDGIFTERASFPSDPVQSGIAVPIFQTFPVEAGVPLIESVAHEPREKALLALFSVVLKVGLAVIAPPGVSTDRVAVLRKAYLEMVTSKEYVDAAKKRGFDTGKPNSGEELAAYIQKSLGPVDPSIKAEFISYTK